MTREEKDQTEKNISLLMSSIYYEIPQEGYYYISSSRKIKKWRTTNLSLNSNHKTVINETLSFSYSIPMIKNHSKCANFLKIKLIKHLNSSKQDCLMEI